MKSRNLAAVLLLLAATPAWADRDSFLSDGEIAMTLVVLAIFALGVLWMLLKAILGWIETRTAKPPVPVARVVRDVSRN